MMITAYSRSAVSFKAGEYDKDFTKHLNDAKKNSAYGQSFVRLIGLDRFSNTTQQKEAIEQAAKTVDPMWGDIIYYLNKAAQEMAKKITAKK